MNILVVEDERNLADAIVRIVSDAGFNCEAVYDGELRPKTWTAK